MQGHGNINASFEKTFVIPDWPMKFLNWMGVEVVGTLAMAFTSQGLGQLPERDTASSWQVPTSSQIS